MNRKYLFALAGGAVIAVIGAFLFDDSQAGAMIGAVIGAGYRFTFCMLREGSA